MHRHLLFAMLACGVIPAMASPVTYMVSVNTSPLQGITGSLDFNFDPGPLVSQAASVQILNFATNGMVAGSPSVTGDASGALPGTLTLDNGSGFNDYFQSFTYGSTLSFNVSLYGPALSSPNGTSSSGSTFAFSLFSDQAGTVPALTTDTTNGFAYLVNVNVDGSTAVTNNIVSAATVPEPASGPLAGLWLLLSIGLGRFKGKHQRWHRS